jgi:hypothetical protein
MYQPVPSANDSHDIAFYYLKREIWNFEVILFYMVFEEILLSVLQSKHYFYKHIQAFTSFSISDTYVFHTWYPLHNIFMCSNIT